MKPSKLQLKLDLYSLIKEKRFVKDAIYGSCIDDKLNAIIFYGAGVSEFRGISETKLPIECLNQCLQFNLSNRMKDCIYGYLESLDG